MDPKYGKFKGEICLQDCMCIYNLFKDRMCVTVQAEI